MLELNVQCFCKRLKGESQAEFVLEVMFIV